MKSESNDNRRLFYDIKRLESSLYKLQAEVTELDPASFDLIHFLDSSELLQESFAKNLPKWPASIQKYINKELLGYVQETKEFKQEDLEVIGGFFETALQEAERCVEGQPPDENWEKAMKALAHELRRYYGLEENDEELPCWRR